MFPEEWKESSDEADFDLVEISLDQMEAAVSAGEPQPGRAGAPQRLRVLRVRPREQAARASTRSWSPEVEGLVWYGARGEDGLAELIADGAGVREVRETRLALDEALDEARGDDRRGRERDDRDHQRRADRLPRGPRGDPDHRRDHRRAWSAPTAGCASRSCAAPCSRCRPASCSSSSRVLLLDSLSQYGEKLEAVVGRRRDRGAVTRAQLVLPQASIGPSGSPATASAARR